MKMAVVERENRRGRKRKVKDVDSATAGGGGGREKVMRTRSSELVGKYVQREFKGSGVLLGRIVNHESGFYRINYEDGRCEDLIRSKVKLYLVEDVDLTDEWSKRKEALDEKLLSEDVNLNSSKKANPIDSSSLSADDVTVRVHDDCSDEVDADSWSGLCSDGRGKNAELVPPPELPPSSRDIGVPEEYVPHLLSVYSFLRSFSVRLFLYPFVLDDFVGALNCSVANTLLDSVHVALMSFLKRQFEKIHSDGSELESKILRLLDWSLLDTLNWPVYLVHYLMARGHKNGDEWKELYAHCLEKDYNTLSVGKKLTALQILCDDVLDTEELRAEVDMREASEVGMDIDTSTMLDICEPARVLTGDSKTFECKDIEVPLGVEKFQTEYSLDNHHMESQVSTAVEDGNGDECRLCGMDGVLVCCDGCPSVYHSRCLGLNKMPNGSWFCPECKINESEPKILRGTTLRGGNVLGVDPYQQVFVASFDHLLVMTISIDSQSRSRYYSRHHIPGVLNALYANPEYVFLYSEICWRIIQYWELSADILPTNEKSGIGIELVNKKECSLCTTQLVDMKVKVLEMTGGENHGTCATGTSAETTGSSIKNCAQQPVSSDNSFDTATKSHSHADSARQYCEILKSTMSEHASSSSFNGQSTNPCGSSQRSNSDMTDSVSTRSSNISSLSQTSLESRGSLISQELNKTVGNSSGHPSNWCLYNGASFNKTGYVNHYLHGDFSASAAANLAILSHEENQVSESHSLDNPQKISIALQVKAFSSAAVRFFWPNVDKKLAEVPRERCSWCFSCKAPLTSKRACLLNAAASTATGVAMKLNSSVRSVTSGGDERLLSIAAYIAIIEESLSGLLVGPFLNESFRKQWRRQLEQAVTCTEVKILLLELDENVRSIAFSGDWMKLVEGFSTQSSAPKVATGSTQKCRPGRRGKKRNDMVEVVADGSQNKLNNFTWWRGGVTSKLMFQRGFLPSSIVKTPARQGGKKKIPGVRYVEGDEIPRISRQLMWRSAVERSMTVADLALQVRYLDSHLRRADIGRPEQMSSYRKSSEAEEASTFRDAVICGKKIVEQEVRYCVVFGYRKHLPSRVMKNIAQKEQILEGGKERYWFSETFIPLYLIKEYEQKLEKPKPVHVLSKLQRRRLKASRQNIFSVLFSELGNPVRTCCSCHQEVFHRNAIKCNACQGICHQECAGSLSEGSDFLVICKLCHDTQAATRVDNSNGAQAATRVDYSNGSQTATRVDNSNGSQTATRVDNSNGTQSSTRVDNSNGTQAAARVDNSNGSPTTPLVPQGQYVPKPAITKEANLVCYKVSSTSFGALEHSSKVKSINSSAASKKNARSNWGLIWRKNNSGETGFDFRLRNILLSGNKDTVMVKPVCRLCEQPYNGDLMYIYCETCKNWFHADALELDESKVFSVVGFKCGRCRRIKSPVCPYSNLLKKNALRDQIEHLLASKMEMIPHHRKEAPTASKVPSNPEVFHVSSYAAVNNPLRISLHEAKQCTEGRLEENSLSKDANVSDPGPSKLTLRRYATPQIDLRCTPADQLEESSSFEASKINYSRKGTNSVEANPLIPVQNSFPSLVLQLASKDRIDLEPESVTENMKFSSSVTHDHEKLMTSAEKHKQTAVACKYCTKSETRTDLCCQICRVTIHKNCSPWYESSSHEDGWRCGSCRDWS